LKKSTHAVIPANLFKIIFENVLVLSKLPVSLLKRNEMTTAQQLHHIWMTTETDDMQEIESCFDAVVPNLPEEFYDDINCVASDNFAYFEQVYNKYTTPIDEFVDTFWDDADKEYARHNDK